MRDKYNTQSKYCYPGTDILINFLDEIDSKKLEKLESTYTTRRIFELYRNPISGSFGLKHLQRIHKYIFQDIYPFAGKLRDEQISKGTTVFAHPLHISTYGNEIFKKLKSEKYLKGLSVQDSLAFKSLLMNAIVNDEPNSLLIHQYTDLLKK